MDESFETLEQKLELLVETSRQLGIMVSDIQPQTQSALNQKIQTLATCLKELDSSKDNFKDVLVPMQVFE
jgi:mediator of RNA polymerase II transcription subunit 10